MKFLLKLLYLNIFLFAFFMKCLSWMHPIWIYTQHSYTVLPFSQTQLSEKEMVRMEIQALLDKFYTKQNQMTQNGNNNGLSILKIMQSSGHL